MKTWKFSIKPDHDKGYDPFLKCKDLGIVGIGWSHGYEEQQPKDIDDAKLLIKKQWGTSDIPQIDKLFYEIEPGDHLWMQKYGHYFLCIARQRKLIGREICDDFRRYDLGHAIAATWLQVPDELVCGSVQRGTIAQRMIQRIYLSDAEERLNKHIELNLQKNPLWFPKIDDNNVSSLLSRINEKTILSILSPDDLEDIVASKLQTEGWILIKSTCCWDRFNTAVNLPV